MLKLQPTSGHTIHASHIEEPRSLFFVMFETGKRWVRVLSQTAEETLSIARYHYGRSGSDFQLLPNPQL